MNTRKNLNSKAKGVDNMKILGIRTSSKEIRYAVVSWDGKTAVLLNEKDETRLKFPATMGDIADKISWVEAEFERIIQNNPDLNKVVIKEREYSRFGETKASREGGFFVSIAMLVSQKNQISVELKLYPAIGTKSKEVKDFSAEHVGVSSKYWNESMADAVAAAYSGRE